MLDKAKLLQIAVAIEIIAQNTQTYNIESIKDIVDMFVPSLITTQEAFFIKDYIEVLLKF
jgi:hypothetical protein